MSTAATSFQKIPNGPVGVSILGSTGSIGANTLDVIARHPDQFRVIALTANKQVDRLIEQCHEYQPEYIVLADYDAAEKAQNRINEAGLDIKVLGGVEGLETVATLDDTQQVMAAIVGAAGLKPTLAAARAGKRVLLANKEALVMSGQLFMDEVHANNAELLPIDSEHNAIFQAMPNDFNDGLDRVGVRKILLTASGGPFLNHSINDLKNVTPEQACCHPNWDMGRKISIDSATMMNKGLEVIEACWLFGTGSDRIEVVIHPQSVIHSMVAYDDGSVLAQLGNPDMRTPIAHAMAWPKRMTSGVEDLDLIQVAHLDFERPDLERFPCLRLAFEAAELGGTSPAILNAANEIAVQAFLDEKIAFTNIPIIIEKTMQQLKRQDINSLESILSADEAARDAANEVVKGLML